MKEFSIQEALLAGWTAFKGRAGFFIVLLLLTGVLTVAPQFAIQPIQNIWLALILGLILLIFQYFIYAGLLKIILAVNDGKEARIGDLFSGGDVFVPYLLGAILVGLIVVAGIFLLVVPGVIASVMFLFYAFFIIDKNIGPVEALKASAALTKEVRWKLFGFMLVLGLLNIVGALLLGLGLFVTIPVSALALAFAYRKLLPQSQFI